MTSSPWDRFSQLVLRELGATTVSVKEAGENAGEGLCYVLPSGRQVCVTFAHPPSNEDVLRRRLEMLATTFVDAIDAPNRRPSMRAIPPRSLNEELRALAQRAMAVDAVVIDANSPVVWGQAHAERETVRESFFPPRGSQTSERDSVPPPPDSMESLRAPPPPGGELISLFGPRTSSANEGTPPQETTLPTVSADEMLDGEASNDSASPPFTQEVLRRVRALPELAGLHRGHHLRRTSGDADLGYALLSFAGIYILVLVYSAPFDASRAEHAMNEALPTIERLVLALPPQDPSPAPVAGAIATTRRRRR